MVQKSPKMLIKGDSPFYHGGRSSLQKASRH
ncbi:uncharacterized protein METZ01_LOCUS64198 [marine metagenome]|uniref:Uncharacterized protein n=1 Tax=marine metagenome TaxID=408172 RepID=A0A381T6J5_9ZZZZ